MKYYGITDRGKIRKQNQDTFSAYELHLNNGVLLVVCDGMGGARGGNIASKMTCEIFSSTVLSGLSPFDDLQQLALLMKRSSDLANTAVFTRSLEDPDCCGMGTTLVAAAVTEQGAAVLNIGDSRCYHLSRRSGIRQVTRDHSVVAEMVANGDITPEQAKTNPNRNLITRAVGTADMVPADYFFVPMEAGDYLLLCSDGLTNVIDDAELAALIMEDKDVQSCCEELISLTLNRGAPDNVTALLFRM